MTLQTVAANASAPVTVTLREEISSIAVLATDMTKYSYVDLTSFNRQEVMGDDLFRVVMFTSEESEAASQFHQEFYLPNPSRTYLCLEEAVDFQKQFATQSYRALAGLQEKITQMISLIQSATGIFFRGFGSSTKDVFLDDPVQRQDREGLVWKRNEGLAGISFDSLFEHVFEMSEFYTKIRSFGHNLSDLVGTLKLPLHKREELKKENKKTIEVLDGMLVLHEFYKINFLTGKIQDRIFNPPTNSTAATAAAASEAPDFNLSEQVEAYAPTGKHRHNFTGKAILRGKLADELEQIALVEQIEASGNPQLVERFSRYLEKLSLMARELSGLEITCSSQFEESLNRIFAIAPVTMIPEEYRKAVLAQLEKLGFSYDLTRIRKSFEYFKTHVAEAALLGVIEREITMTDRKERTIRNSSQVMMYLLRSERAFLDIQSALQSKQPYGLGFARHDHRDQEYRFLTNRKGNLVAGSSQIHNRSRATVTLLDGNHPLPKLVSKAATEFYYRPMGKKDPLTGKELVFADELLPNRRLAAYIAHFLKHTTPAAITHEYVAPKLDLIVDMAIDVNIFTQKVLKAKLGELNPGFHPEDEVQIADFNSFTSPEVEQLVAQDNPQIVMRIAAYSAAAVCAASLEAEGKEFTFDAVKTVLAMK